MVNGGEQSDMGCHAVMQIALWQAYLSLSPNGPQAYAIWADFAAVVCTSRTAECCYALMPNHGSRAN